MLAGALARVTDPDGEGVFATKGGIAMELRLGDRARVTRDVDIVIRGNTDDLPSCSTPAFVSPIRALRLVAERSTISRRDRTSRRRASRSCSQGAH